MILVTFFSHNQQKAVPTVADFEITKSSVVNAQNAMKMIKTVTEIISSVQETSYSYTEQQFSVL
jgi:hypothetical protein